MTFPIQIWFDDQLQVDGVPERLLDGQATLAFGADWKMYQTVKFQEMRIFHTWVGSTNPVRSGNLRWTTN